MQQNILKLIEEEIKNDKIEFVTIEKLCNIRNGYTPSKKEKSFWTNGSFPWFRMEDLRLSSSRIISDSIQHITLEAIRGKNYFKANSIIIATTATIGEHALITTDYLANQQFTNLEIKAEFKELITPKFLFYYSFLLSEFCKQNVNNSAFPSVQMDEFRQFKIPIPSTEIQNKIVSILDEFSRLEARNQQYNYYLNYLMNFENGKAENVEFLKLSEIAKINSGVELTKDNMKDDYPYPVMGGGYKPTGRYYDYNSESGIAIAKDGVYAGFVNWIDTNFWCTGHCYTVKSSSEKTTNKFLFYYLKSKEYEIKGQKIGSAIPSIYKDILNKIIIPLPSLEEQNRIVNILDKFSKLTSDINEGLPAEIKMRRQQYEYYREKLLTFSTS
ncbi:restriction endonuclease subunit S [Mycoplasmopsis agassizii]|uniref:Restriction endonuclease subunit S n=1 Tax=Mycoplasmopsis agassizii TaxID=33922 RepID=A0ABX4H623_9BACT|nr:restriction endonuclease subunit S [Mycoplasmopsis agassizii]PAF55331.1 restriction endonuclease subunit S [Mycoplasmopsis agassizii]SMC15782.1 type I restriction enzyme, S subunit [Mycoplasmopsis agassizii]